FELSVPSFENLHIFSSARSRNVRASLNTAHCVSPKHVQLTSTSAHAQQCMAVWLWMPTKTLKHTHTHTHTHTHIQAWPHTFRHTHTYPSFRFSLANVLSLAVYHSLFLSGVES